MKKIIEIQEHKDSGRFVDKEGNIYKKMKGSKDKDGYIRTVIKNGDKKFSTSVHRMVLEAWNPVEDSDYLFVNHIDEDKTNNSLSNLEWCTHQENMSKLSPANRKKLGLNKRLSKEEILYIRANPDKLTQKRLGEKFGVSITTIKSILKRKTYKNI